MYFFQVWSGVLDPVYFYSRINTDVLNLTVTRAITVGEAKERKFPVGDDYQVGQCLGQWLAASI